MILIRCNGATPKCHNCTRKGEDTCEYVVALKRRGPGRKNRKDKSRMGSSASPDGGLPRGVSAEDGGTVEVKPAEDDRGVAGGSGSRFEISTARA
jgi:hypothetical protein